MGTDERGKVSVILKTSLPEFGDRLDVGIEVERSCILDGGRGRVQGWRWHSLKWDSEKNEEDQHLDLGAPAQEQRQWQREDSSVSLAAAGHSPCSILFQIWPGSTDTWNPLT